MNDMSESFLDGVKVHPMYLIIAYGARCTWWDSIDKVGTLVQPVGPNDKRPMAGLPCCPRCRNMLFQVDNIGVWQDGVNAYAKKTDDPKYIEFIAWMRGKCYPTMDAARKAFDKESFKPIENFLLHDEDNP